MCDIFSPPKTLSERADLLESVSVVHVCGSYGESVSIKLCFEKCEGNNALQNGF